ncbi:MAG TPA: putative quinol monooxygenase [Terracidiphilus sp.]|nr:putative quinol monooxygenase [Terracidiphilus sp.]
MEIVRVIARAEARDGKAEDLKLLLRSLVMPTRAEQGCRYYEFFESNLTGVFYFNELWNSLDDLKAHASTPRFLDVMAKAKELLRAPMEVNLLSEVE